MLGILLELTPSYRQSNAEVKHAILKTMSENTYICGFFNQHSMP